ncbi:pantoate--beta-alanine ligase [Methylococcus geothermalis]|uniref:Pantothenate synthetase n=1 Tax=Methylococcus geothermalis TaxID=2681310 RepID=A0A858QAT4_9GAMM|nr:pantoate--beta-alanine ligase [Methylococcus geothermalis]QJD31017.1 pantoate--beta-alanine ligase [Methylococcus geothermalis]
MIIVRTKTELEPVVARWRAAGETIAFVPTMGNLHAGHLHLVDTARAQSDRVVVSIFVNPTQFAPGEDLAAYPRTPEQDIDHLRSRRADLLYLPEASDVYPESDQPATFVEVPGLSDQLCGQFRPGHFRGVATVVCKLLNRVRPDIALFGEKDFQQLAIIRQMVRDLDIPVRILGVPTVREPNGLAMSSRNGYLTPEERERAALIYHTLTQAADAMRRGARDYSRIEGEATDALEAGGFSVDYVSIRRQQDLAAPSAADDALVILAAARLGKARLIDNLLIFLDASH